MCLGGCGGYITKKQSRMKNNWESKIEKFKVNTNLWRQMVNGLYLCSAVLVLMNTQIAFTVQVIAIHPFTHTVHLWAALLFLCGAIQGFNITLACRWENEHENHKCKKSYYNIHSVISSHWSIYFHLCVDFKSWGPLEFYHQCHKLHFGRIMCSCSFQCSFVSCLTDLLGSCKIQERIKLIL